VNNPGYRLRDAVAREPEAVTPCSASTATGQAGTPASPSALTAVARDADQVRLTWSDNAADALFFKLFRRRENEPWELAAIVGAGETSLADGGARGNSSSEVYWYHLRACNNSGCSPRTAAAAVPLSPSGLTATVMPADGIGLEWTATDFRQTGVVIYRKDGDCASPGAWIRLGTTPTGVVGYQDRGLAAGTYAYRISAERRSPAEPQARGESLPGDCVSLTLP
jgi:hypothetical protein